MFFVIRYDSSDDDEDEEDVLIKNCGCPSAVLQPGEPGVLDSSVILYSREPGFKMSGAFKLFSLKALKGFVSDVFFVVSFC